jgi:hypothetical protein
MFFFTKYIYKILDYYRTHLIFFDTIPIGFAGVANERPAPVFTNEVSEDVLYFGGELSFSNAGVLVRIKAISPQYEWMVNDDPAPQDTPANAVFGVFSQSLPIIPWVSPFFLKKQGRLQLQWTNSAAGPTTGGFVTLHGLRLTNPVNGTGWDYNIGLTS